MSAPPSKTPYTNSTTDSIKRAYKRKALELHPDRNYNDVERTTKLFAEVSAAYEILSDPQERSWYDSHRDAILRGDSDGGGGGGGGAGYADVTTTGDVLRWFSQFRGAISFKDGDPRGFYAVLDKAFGTLADEELAAFHELDAADDYSKPAPRFPAFGTASTPYEGPGGVKEFYAAWINFRTAKTFAWEEVYRYSDAPDRRVKRAMEKENAKLREGARREFIDTVVEFVRFVRKRDPRYTSNLQTEAQRQAALLKASREQALRQRRENAEARKAKQSEAEVASWTRFEQASDGDEVGVDAEVEEEWGSGGGNTDNDDDEVNGVFECVICRKTFRSNGQMDAHEKSKKHVKAVKDLQRQMRKEHKEFDLDRDVRGREKPGLDFEPVDLGGDAEEAEEELLVELEAAGNDDDEEHGPAQENGSKAAPHPPAPPAPQNGHTPASEDHDEDDDDDDDADTPDADPDSDYVSPETFASRLTISDPSTPDADTSDSTPAASAKVGKAKAKRLKRAQQQQQQQQAQEDSDNGGEFSCQNCAARFPSKTKLFAHLEQNPGHATPIPAPSSAAARRRQKAKKGRK